MSESSPAVLEIRLFGPMDVRVGGKPISRLRSRRGYWLLALLTLRAGREVERDWLAGTLWPDSDEGQALSSLRRTLTDLRTALGDEAFRLENPSLHTLRLEVSGAFADVVAFDAAVKAGETDTLEKTVALYRGTLLEGCYETWVEQERTSREEAYLTVLEKLAEHAKQNQESERAIHFLRLAASADPLRETVQRSLMRALSESGNVAAASLVYREFRQRLYRDMNAEPDPETAALAKEIQVRARERMQREASSSPPALPPSPSPPSPKPGSNGKSHAVVSLPHFLTDCIGREQDIQETVDSLSTHRLLTLVGMGGVGKTRLAVRVAEVCRARFSEGVWFIDLSSTTDPELVPQAVAKVIGVSETPGQPLAESLMEHISEKSCLLVPDNCEHLRDAGTDLIRFLLKGCPNLHILATGRQSLGIPGEMVRSVPPLKLPQGDTLARLAEEPEALLEYSALRLFAERAQAVAPTFLLSEKNARPVTQICRRLDGIPLAIELAAARVRSLSPEQIEARLSDRFRLLVGGSRSLARRQQTLRDLIDWSYNLLEPSERTLFRRLSVFAGGWTLEAAEAVCAEDASIGRWALSVEERMEAFARNTDPVENDTTLPFSNAQYPTPNAQRLTPNVAQRLESHDILDLLTALADKSLVACDMQEEEMRFRFLESIREYSRERLEESGETEPIRHNHAAFFLELAEQSHNYLFGAEQARWLARLEREHDNLRVALAWTKEAGGRRPKAGAERRDSEALRLAGALGPFWYVRGHLTEGRKWLEEALAQDTDSQPNEARARALDMAGRLVRNQGELEAAQRYYEESLEQWRTLGDRTGIAGALNSLGNIAFEHGDFEVARRLYAEGLSIRQELDDPRAIAHSIYCLACTAQCLGDLDSARNLYQQSLKVQRELQDERGIATALFSLGAVHLDLDDLETAEELLGESLTLRQSLGNPAGMAESLYTLGVVAERQGDFGKATALLEESRTLFESLGDRWGLSMVFHARGTVDRREGSTLTAFDLHTESLRIKQAMGNKQGIAESLEEFAMLAHLEGQAERGAMLLGAAQGLRESIGSPIPPGRQREMQMLLGELQSALGAFGFSQALSRGRTLDPAQASALTSNTSLATEGLLLTIPPLT